MKKEPFIPQYKLIYNQLKEGIEKGVYKSGEQLPYERLLCEQFHVERITVRRTLEMLANEGLIVKRAGVGSFVSATAVKEEPQVKPKTLLFGMHRNQNDIEHNVNAFNAQLFFLMEQYCRAQGYSLMYCGIPDGGRSLPKTDQAIAGIMLISMQSDELVKNAIDTGLPVICINHYDPRVLCIVPDNHHGAELAVEHLYSLGHRRIAFINGTPHYQNAIERLEGFQRALTKFGLPLQSEYIINGNWTFDRGRTAMEDLLNNLPESRWPTAVFTASDMTAMGALEGLKNRGLKIPDDVSVVGFDNIEMCNYCSPPLTSIQTSARQLADISVDHMLRLIDRGVSGSDHYVIRLPSEFICRASTAGPS